MPAIDTCTSKKCVFLFKSLEWSERIVYLHVEIEQIQPAYVHLCQKHCFCPVSTKEEPVLRPRNFLDVAIAILIPIWQSSRSPLHVQMGHGTILRSLTLNKVSKLEWIRFGRSQVESACLLFHMIGATSIHTVKRDTLCLVESQLFKNHTESVSKALFIWV